MTERKKDNGNSCQRTYNIFLFLLPTHWMCLWPFSGDCCTKIVDCERQDNSEGEGWEECLMSGSLLPTLELHYNKNTWPITRNCHAGTAYQHYVLKLLRALPEIDKQFTRICVEKKGLPKKYRNRIGQVYEFEKTLENQSGIATLPGRIQWWTKSRPFFSNSLALARAINLTIRGKPVHGCLG